MYRRKPVLKCDFNKVAKQITLRDGCSPVNLLHIFRTPLLPRTPLGGFFWIVTRSNYVFYMSCMLLKQSTPNRGCQLLHFFYNKYSM